MLKDLYELGKQVLTLAQDTRENKRQIKELQQQVEQLTRAVQHLAFELQRVKDNEAHEREKLVLRLENALLRFERRLPAGKEMSRRASPARMPGASNPAVAVRDNRTKPGPEACYL